MSLFFILSVTHFFLFPVVVLSFFPTAYIFSSQSSLVTFQYHICLYQSLSLFGSVSVCLHSRPSILVTLRDWNKRGTWTLTRHQRYSIFIRTAITFFPYVYFFPSLSLSTQKDFKRTTVGYTNTPWYPELYTWIFIRMRRTSPLPLDL